MTIQTINPATGILIKTYESLSEHELTSVIDSMHDAFLKWRALSFDERGRFFKKLAELLLKNKRDYAALITQEMGKPILAAIAEVEKCAMVCQHAADFSKEFLKPDYYATENSKSYVMYEPLGVIFAIMPWNFPFWQVFRFAAPNLMAGNVVLLKHAPAVTGCALLVEHLFYEVHFPANVFRTVILEEAMAKQAIEHKAVRGVTLTGSVRAGKAVGALAGQAIKKMVLELGGSDPYIVLKDADLSHAATVCVAARLAVSGQVCISAKRLIIVKSVFEEFKNLVMEKVKSIQASDPAQEDCALGPLAREDLRAYLHAQVQRSITKGATCLLGGEIPAGPGFYYPVTVLTNVKPGMPAYDEELFGPVIAFIQAEDEADAIRIANDTEFGLSAAIFTKNREHGEKIAAMQLEVGTCCVNRQVSSHPGLPFGGTKSSGFGREMSAIGIKEFMNAKTIMVV